MLTFKFSIIIYNIAETEEILGCSVLYFWQLKAFSFVLKCLIVMLIFLVYELLSIFRLVRVNTISGSKDYGLFILICVLNEFNYFFENILDYLEFLCKSRNEYLCYQKARLIDLITDIINGISWSRGNRLANLRSQLLVFFWLHLSFCFLLL